MADYLMTSANSVVLRFDENNDETDRYFLLEHDGGGAGKELFKVNEGGVITMYGSGVINRNTVHHVESTAGSGDIARFIRQGSVKAAVRGDGAAMFGEGLRLRRITGSDPDTAGLAGATGEIVLWYNSGSGKNEIWACYDGTTPHWNRATQ